MFKVINAGSWKELEESMNQWLIDSAKEGKGIEVKAVTPVLGHGAFSIAVIIQYKDFS